MKIIDILPPDSVVVKPDIQTKKEMLKALSDMAARKTGVNERVIADALTERERLGTTGIGRGVALPHTRLANLKKIYCAFLKTAPVDFESVDNKPVDLAFLLLVPEDAGADHLKALARLSRLLRDDAIAAQMRATDDPKALYRLIAEADGADA
ncbi:MAG: PTS sugar transporter subunit IIA [Alphaproteobacteria bacterium]|nr:PTS sugar transporter subunit IIA [Alphaproteobacteria bacterium]